MPHLNPPAAGEFADQPSLREIIDEELQALEARAKQQSRSAAMHDEAAVAEAIRRYKAAKAARASATPEAIQSTGLKPNLKLLLASEDKVVEQRLANPTKRRKIVSPGCSIPVVLPIHQNPSPAAAAAGPSAARSHPGLEPGQQQPRAQTMSTKRAPPSMPPTTLRDVQLALSGNLDALRARHMHSRFDLLGALFAVTELAVEVGKHLRPGDVLNLFSISRVFHETISLHLTSSTAAWARYNAPVAYCAFPFNMYARFCTLDPAGRSFHFGTDPTGSSQIVDVAARQSDTIAAGPAAAVATTGPSVTPGARAGSTMLYDAAQAPAKPCSSTTGGSSQPGTPTPRGSRLVPALRWYQLVVFRERAIRDILACLARAGHRTPSRMPVTLAKLWVVLDVPTNGGREALMRNKRFMTHYDLYNASMFFTKLDLRFSDPCYTGPMARSPLRRLVMGQRDGLATLWRLLTRRDFTFDLSGLVRLKLRYDYVPTPAQEELGLPVFGVPLEELGTGHLEGWGKGKVHLLRPDELVPIEAMRRRLPLGSCTIWFALWGNIDWHTGRNLVPSAQELRLFYPEDEKELGPLTDDEFEPVHARLKQWAILPKEERREYRRVIEDAKLQGLAMAYVSQAQDEEIESDDEDLSWFSDVDGGSEDDGEPAKMTRPATPLKETMAKTREGQPTAVRSSNIAAAAVAEPPPDSSDDELLKSLALQEYDQSDLDLDKDDYWGSFIAARRNRSTLSNLQGRSSVNSLTVQAAQQAQAALCDHALPRARSGAVGAACRVPSAGNGDNDDAHDPAEDADDEETDDDDYMNQDHGWFSC